MLPDSYWQTGLICSTIYNAAPHESGTKALGPDDFIPTRTPALPTDDLLLEEMKLRREAARAKREEDAATIDTAKVKTL